MRITLTVFLFIISLCPISGQNDLEKNSCATEDCHESMINKTVIHPALEDGCETCHDSNGKEHPDNKGPEFTLTESGSDLCETCHDVEATKKVVHVPFEEGECTACHSPHSSNVTALMKETSMKETCAQCHDFDSGDDAFGHGPFLSDQCTSCHFGHQSDFESLTILEGTALCFQCHEDKSEDMKLANIHPAFEDGCLNCHSPHTSPADHMLVTAGNELCFTCHGDIADDISKAKMVHNPLAQDEGCVSCHTPHAGELNKLLLDKQPDLCIKCHGENTKKKTKFIDIASRMEKKFIHEPLSEGQCDDCHLPHTGNNNHMLQEAFPNGNYSKPNIENYAMCFDCHDSEKITNRETTTDTNFRDGTRNLHFVHVMKKKSISCQSCHDMHGADNKNIIGDFVYFGKWEMPINYKITETGGSCLPGCHVQQIYDRDK